MNITIVVAVSENNGIGKNNQLPWHLPNDLKFFKKVTMGGTMIMGRKTFESIGKPLPGRETIMVTTQPDYKADGCIIASSLQDAIDKSTNRSEVFIVGGGELFKQVLPLTHTLYLTKVHHHIDADVFFPVINMSEWNVESEEPHHADERHKYAYTFFKLNRK
ncbi:MAG: dihydrofolate reductase [Bacteroidia bacterium]